MYHTDLYRSVQSTDVNCNHPRSWRSFSSTSVTCRGWGAWGWLVALAFSSLVAAWTFLKFAAVCLKKSLPKLSELKDLHELATSLSKSSFEAFQFDRGIAGPEVMAGHTAKQLNLLRTCSRMKVKCSIS